MNIQKFLPLTETTFYILLALNEPGHGYAVMKKIEELSDNKVKIAAGTMYGALENLSKQKLIELVESTDPRRKVYMITDEGKAVLTHEVERLKRLISIYEVN